jgi:hypothetical protein
MLLIVNWEDDNGPTSVLKFDDSIRQKKREILASFIELIPTHIWSFILSSPTLTVFIIKSTPIVADCPGGNIPCVNLRTKQVFPTPAFPKVSHSLQLV